MSIFLPGFGPVNNAELNAIRKARRVIEQRKCSDNNECFSSLFNWGGEQQQVSKSVVEPGEPANHIFANCFPRL